MYRINFRVALITGLLLISPLFVSAETKVFNIDSSYDLLGRERIEVELIRTTSNLYFYVEKDWWGTITPEEQNTIKLALFGLEPKPGIDRDEKITVLIHQMPESSGGYFSSGDVYSRLQYPISNEREMVYLNSQHIASFRAKSFLAHEFVHLITVNQKDLARRVEEEVWLNE